MSANKSLQIGFQGEVGAFSEAAAAALFPGCETLPLESFKDVFAAVTAGTVPAGVIPIENSLFGSVHINYDHLREHDVVICGEVHLRVRHNLLALPGATLGGIARVLSHPQALGQCREFLESELAEAEIVPCYDTAGAARMVAQSRDPSWAAIASQRAAQRHNLEALAEGIESNHQNYTRFLSLEKVGVEHEVEGRDFKTSIVYSMRENVPGALFKSLAVFALRDLDLLKIESRPLIGSPGKYIFYLDLKGRSEIPAIQKALDHLGEIAAFVKVLGSYPFGETVE